MLDRFCQTAPAVGVAIAATAGIIIDRYGHVPPLFALAFAASAAIGWLSVGSYRIVFLLAGFAAIGALWHHVRHIDAPVDGIARLASIDGSPLRLRGYLVAPTTRVPGSDDPLQTIPRPETTKLIFDVAALVETGGNTPTSGRIVVYVTGTISDVYVGDELEMAGRLVTPRSAGNPGEYDPAQDLRDQGIGAMLSVKATPDAVVLIARRWPASISGWLGRLHGECKAILDRNLRLEPALAAALLLGDGSGLGRPEWDKFLKSGVVHALAISGQHLMVLAAFLAFLRKRAFVRLRPATLGIAAALLAYALLTGGRAPAMRAAWVVLVVCLATLIRRRSSPANTFAIAWLGVIVVSPADIFQTGCQLSFLAVALLQWAVEPWIKSLDQNEPFDDLGDPPSRSWRRAERLAKALRSAYLANALIWLGVTPLVADRFHVVSPVALLIGPPVVLATSIALIFGFLLLMTAPLSGILATPFAWITDGALYACEMMIDWGLHLPGATFTVCDVPAWWTILFYIALLSVLFAPKLRSRWLLAAGVAWLGFGLAFGLGAMRRPEFRIAFLSVGHGGCTVIETSGGKVLVYDAGSMTGPDLSRRVIIPYLWSRGLTHIDDLFISHADLDHFSGVPDLLERVAVRRVTLTPSFADRNTPAVRRVRDDFQRRGIETRIIKAGDSEQIDDLKLDILHPPLFGPEGKENARSLVMLVRKSSFATLLTGDLEDLGLDQLLRSPPPGLDVFMAPHHGGRLANPVRLAAWARPRITISNQGRPRGIVTPTEIYESVGARYLTTYHHGAIIVFLRGGDLCVETCRSKESLRLGPIPVR